MPIIDSLELSENTKTAFSLNLPAKVTCPGKTASCEEACYADKGRMRMNGALVTGRNLTRLQKDVTSVERMKLPKSDAIAIRLLGAGDIFSLGFGRALFRLCDNNPKKRFWMYTRSFSILRQLLRERQVPANLVLFVSADVDNIEDAKYMAEKYNLPIAYMGEVAEEVNAFTCPAIANPAKLPLTKRKAEAPCQRCKYCFNAKTEQMRLVKGVRFPIH